MFNASKVFNLIKLIRVHYTHFLWHIQINKLKGIEAAI